MTALMTAPESRPSQGSLQAQIEDWLSVLGVVCRQALTYLIRSPEQAQQKRRRDQGIEYHLQRLHRQGELVRRRVAGHLAYYRPARQLRGQKLEHDLWAGLVAARLYSDFRRYALVSLSRQTRGALEPDWTLELHLGAEKFCYYLEFHSRKNPLVNLERKLASYHQADLAETEVVLIVCQSPTAVGLPSEHFALASLTGVLAAGNGCREPIWEWGGNRGRANLVGD
jgi:hypothetical protein